jgi:hypothetical protein
MNTKHDINPSELLELVIGTEESRHMSGLHQVKLSNMIRTFANYAEERVGPQYRLLDLQGGSENKNAEDVAAQSLLRSLEQAGYVIVRKTPIPNPAKEHSSDYIV